MEELHQNARGKEKMTKTLDAIEQARLEECPFQPRTLHHRVAGETLNPDALDAKRHHMNLANPPTIVQRIKEYQEERQKKVAEFKANAEHNDLKECTFTPRTLRRSRRNSDSTVLVRGYSRHMELQEMARKKKTDLEEREQKAFLKNVGK